MLDNYKYNKNIKISSFCVKISYNLRKLLPLCFNFTKKMSEIKIKGARVHNLKNISVNIPLGELTVVTGLSGSGKSSLAFDTLYAEGQRRYVESLSSYARQFLGRIKKPDVDFIEGIPPSIAIEQKVNTSNSRSTVGTVTEIYDYIKLLYARIGKTFSPVSGKEVKADSIDDVVDFISKLPEKSKLYICTPVKVTVNPSKQVELLIQQGFTRAFIDGKLISLNDAFIEIIDKELNEFNLLIDRIKTGKDVDKGRIADSVQTAYYEGNGVCTLFWENKNDENNIHEQSFSNKFEADGIKFERPTLNTFNFNNPLGACPRCEGYGQTIDIDPDLVIPNKNLSVYQDAVVCWKGEKMSWFKNELIKNASKFNFPIHTPYRDLTQKQKDILWNGNSYFTGIYDFFKMLEAESYKIQYRVMLARYRGKTVCPDCKGTRLKKEAGYIKVGGKAISELVNLPIDELLDFFTNLRLNEHDFQIANRIVQEITERLKFLIETGLSYLNLNRNANTLSGGETQRINLTTSLGSSLVGSLYVLDEPSIGLHPHDNNKLIGILKHLRDIGNTVLVVEHDETLMREADHIIDMGPEAGINGGELVFSGKFYELLKQEGSLTADYLSGKKIIPTPERRRKWNNFLEIKGASAFNLKNIDVKIPLNILTVITGVSGSGKSTLIKKIFYPGVKRLLDGYGEKPGEHSEIAGDINLIHNIEYVDQNPIGRSSRSNPVTYIKAYDDIRKLFAEQKASKLNGFKPAHFSFNVEGGRCPECQGEGVIKIEMQFMADVTLVCESCKGKRFKPDILDVKYRGKSIYDVLEMSVDEAIELFAQGKSTLEKNIVSKLQVLSDVGLGYVKLGQSSSTLSGGESQRIKLAFFLTKESDKPAIFVFDEPSTGLHFHDINKLLVSINRLIDNGNTVIIIEHNLDIIKNADYIVDLGPGGGKYGGELIFSGTPEDLIKCKKSLTGKYLAEKL